ncbi:MAG: hypothetical protein ACE5G2_11845 [Candidatus Krumholzibacteriia bacterium]
MVFELDWLEREERYKTRITRILTSLTMLVAVLLGVGMWVKHRQEQAISRAAAEAQEMARLAEIARERAAYAADSVATAERLAAFIEAYGAESAEGAPILVVRLPARSSVGRYLRQVWSDFARVIEPEVGADDQRAWFKRRYVDVMNRAWYDSAGGLVWEGEMRPEAILIPAAKQKGKDLVFEKPTFNQIVRAQEIAGIRPLEEPEMLEGDPSLTQNVPEPADVETASSP